MSTSLDYFSRGITRAFERRAKEQAKQQQSNVQKINSHAIESNEDAVPVTPTLAPPTSPVKLSNDEQYRIDILTKMKARISQQKRK